MKSISRACVFHSRMFDLHSNSRFIKLVQGATTVDERTRQYQMQISKLESARDTSDSRCRELESMISRALSGAFYIALIGFEM